MKFDPNASPPCYRSKDEIIQKDTKVRIEIVGCRVEATDIVSKTFHRHISCLYFAVSGVERMIS